MTGQSLDEEDIVTASGLVTHRLGGFPKVGDVLSLGHHELRVTEMDGMRVSKLQLKKMPAPEDTATAESQA